MASNTNCATGNIVMEPKAIGDGGAAKARIAITDGYTKKNGDEKKASFADMIVFGRDAEYLLKYGQVGKPYTLMGATLEVRQYETEKGRGTAVELVGGRLTLPKVDAGASGGSADEDSPF